MKKTKKCENCSVIYDPFLRECPICEHPNDTHPLKDKYNKMLFTDSTKEILFFLTGLISTTLFTMLFSMGISKFKIDENLRNSIITLLSYMFSLGIIFCVLSYDNKKYWKHYKDQNFLIFGILIFTAMLFFSSLANEIYNVTGISRGINDNEAKLRALVKAQPVMMFFITVVFAPIIEEITFRLGLFTVLFKNNKYLAYIITIVLFAFMHINFNAKDLATEFVNLPFYLILGLLLTYGYEKGGIGASTFAHSLNNLVSFILVLTIL